MSEMASYITILTIVYSKVYSSPDQTKHQSSASLAFVRGIHRGPVNSPYKGPVTRKMFPFDDVIMWQLHTTNPFHKSHNASDKYPRMHNCVTLNLHTIENCALWGLVLCGICETGLLQCEHFYALYKLIFSINHKVIFVFSVIYLTEMTHIVNEIR